jgi:hypothetical protein
VKLWMVAACLGVVVLGASVAIRHQSSRARTLENERAALLAEQAKLRGELDATEGRARFLAGLPAEREHPARPNAYDIIARMQKLPTGQQLARSLRQAVHDCEELTALGPAALPAIRGFLARGQDLDLDVSWVERNRGRDRLPGEFVAPPSLRFGLFDVLRQIGGAEAAEALGDTLAASGRGVEIAFLTRVLHELAPNRYREQAVATARSLLAANGTPPAGSALDRNHRDHLYAVLAFYKDGSFAEEAKAQIAKPEGPDRAALAYLKTALGRQSVPLAATAYQNVADPGKREPLARVALDFVGVDPAADQFFQQAINDLSLPKDARRNLIEDLNEGGLDDKNLSAKDLPLIEKRLALIEQLAPKAADPVNAAAFKEAYKDLQNMRQKLQSSPR